MIENRSGVDGKANRLARRILYRIATGQLRPGERLPPLRTAQREWAVSQSTVVRAYDSLADAGYIEGRHRNGYFVRQCQAVDLLSQGRADLERLHGVVAEFVHDETQFTIIGALRSVLELAEVKSLRHPECGVVECTAFQAHDLSAQVRSRLDIPCEGILLRNLVDGARPPSTIRIVLTTKFHESVVAGALRDEQCRLLSVEVRYAVDVPTAAAPYSQAVVVAVDGDQAAAISNDLSTSVDPEYGIDVWRGIGRPTGASLATLTPPPNTLLVLSPTLWETAPAALLDHASVVPLRTVVTAGEWPRVAATIGVPVPPA